MSTVRSDIPSRPAPAHSFRAMRIADLPAVMDIEQRAYEFCWTEGIFRDCLAVGYRSHVILLDGKVAGYGVVSAAAGEAHILNLCVDPHQRRRGLGRALLNHLIEDARAASATVLLLEVRPSNAAGIALYEQLGFKRIGMRKDYYPAKGGREDAIMLEREIS
ncbi:MAG: ribosomal protein S18-alanine N-acetyltransferase [Gammaproteobacteria bacterium]|nr:ribosomal protein S18-alanine N-acetyltransferase [Gammaproteobacteria bacterium]